MHVFISYPRELKEFAEKLNIQLNINLSNQNITIFRDLENISLGELWSRKILENIEKADLFIVLYLAKAIEDKTRFFGVEIDLIEKKCKENKNIGLITIIFPPTKTKDLRPYFKARQCHLSSELEDPNYWIVQILQEVKKKKPGHIKLRLQNYKQLFLYFSVSIIFVIATVYFLISLEHSPIKSLFAKAPPRDEQIGRSVCNSLRGKYELDHEYIFSWDANSRAIAIHDTTWTVIPPFLMGAYSREF